MADAIRSGGHPGEIRIFDAVEQKLPTGNLSAGCTHAFGLAAVVELGRSLDLPPRTLIVIGVEATQFEPGSPMSDAVDAAVPAAADAVFAAIDNRAGRS